MDVQAAKAMEAEQKQQRQLQQSYMEKGVMLEPFLHQVGGHCCVLRLGEQTICKPLITREHQFYESVPDELRKFIPQYRGNASHAKMCCCCCCCCCGALVCCNASFCPCAPALYAYVQVRREIMFCKLFVKWRFGDFQETKCCF